MPSKLLKYYAFSNSSINFMYGWSFLHHYKLLGRKMQIYYILCMQIYNSCLQTQHIIHLEPGVFKVVRVTRSLGFCIVFCRSLLVLFLYAMMLSVKINKTPTVQQDFIQQQLMFVSFIDNTHGATGGAGTTYISDGPQFTIN